MRSRGGPFQRPLGAQRQQAVAVDDLEADVEAALALLLSGAERITVDAVKLLASTGKRIEVPDLEPLPGDLGAYDALIGEVGT